MCKCVFWDRDTENGISPVGYLARVMLPAGSVFNLARPTFKEVTFLVQEAPQGGPTEILSAREMNLGSSRPAGALLDQSSRPGGASLPDVLYSLQRAK